MSTVWDCPAVGCTRTAETNPATAADETPPPGWRFVGVPGRGPLAFCPEHGAGPTTVRSATAPVLPIVAAVPPAPVEPEAPRVRVVPARRGKRPRRRLGRWAYEV